jgi:CIC family chloride channel protein
MGKERPLAARAFGPLGLSLWAVLVGAVAGMGAVVFRGLIAVFHNLLFLGQLSVAYDANVHTPASPWGPLVVLVPVVGAVGVAFLVKNFAPEAKGHGVPEVMDATYYSKGVIRPVVAAIKSLASALSIGSGGAVGREGPIIQIGSSFGSTLAQLVRMPTKARITLIAAGAGGGIAATFNTPIGGVLFAVELMMHEISVRTLVPVTLATATATYVGRLCFGNHPSFLIPAFEQPYFQPTSPLVLLSYVGLGLVMGIASVLFIRAVYHFEDFFEQRVPGNYYTRHMLGMLIVGIMIYALLAVTGHYYVEGVGYATIQDVLSGQLVSLGLLAILFVLKLLATSLTLGSGASGGIFSPSLFMGATLGAAYGLMAGSVPGLKVDPPAFAVAGMGGLVGGATGAPITAIVMIFEMTRDYNVIIPITLTVAISFGLRQFLCRESIYTLKLARRGHIMPQALRADFYQLRRAHDLMGKNIVTVPDASTLGDVLKNEAEFSTVSAYLARGDDGVLGVVTRVAALQALLHDGRGTALRQIADQHFVRVSERTPLFDVMRIMRARHASVALVTRGGQRASVDNVVGVITKEQIANAVTEETELFSDGE